MAKILSIADYFNVEQDCVFQESPFDKNISGLQPLIHPKNQELLGYYIHFPIHQSKLIVDPPRGVISIKQVSKRVIQIPKYNPDKYFGRWVFDPDKSFLGTVYDEKSTCQEYESLNMGGAIIYFDAATNFKHLIGFQSDDKVVKHKVGLNISNPLLLILEYHKNY